MARRPPFRDPSRRRPPPRDTSGGRPGRTGSVAERDLDRVAGLPAVAALFATAKNRVQRLFFTPEFAAEAAPFLPIMATARKPYREVLHDELERISGTAMHGGIVALAEPRRINEARADDLKRTGDPLLLLDGVGNPQNIGAIARTAAFFGLRRLLISDHPDQAGLSDASHRIAKGGLAYVDVLRAYDVPTFLAAMRGAYTVVGTALERGRPLDEIAADPELGRRPFLVVMGNEEHGLPRATVNACEAIVRLPGSGHVQSLNVSVTAGILIHALLRPGTQPKKPAAPRPKR